LKVFHNRTVTDYEIKVFGLEKTNNNLTVDLATLNSWKAMMEEKYQSERTAWEGEMGTLTAETESVKAERESLRGELE
jgi:hypothetical protein